MPFLSTFPYKGSSVSPISPALDSKCALRAVIGDPLDDIVSGEVVSNVVASKPLATKTVILVKIAPTTMANTVMER